MVMIQFVAAADSAGPVDEVLRPACIDLGIVSGQVDLLQVIPEVRVFGQYAGISAGTATRQAVFQAQPTCLGRADSWAG